MPNDPARKASVGTKIAAVLLIFGAVLGLVGSIPLFGQLVRQQDFFRLATVAISIVLFGWCGWVGWALWRGWSWAKRWATILFALQVPVCNLAGVVFEFSTGLSFRFLLSGSMPVAPGQEPSHSLTFGGNVGSSFNLNLSPGDSNWMVGLNLVAVFVCLYLLRRSGGPKGQDSREVADEPKSVSPSGAG